MSIKMYSVESAKHGLIMVTTGLRKAQKLAISYVKSKGAVPVIQDKATWYYGSANDMITIKTWTNQGRVME